MNPIVSQDPATGEAFAETPATAPTEVASAINKARTAHGEWALRPLVERLTMVRRFQRLLFDRRQEMAALITRENGKPLAESLLTEVAVVLDFARYYVDHAEAMLRPRRVRFGNVAFIGKRGRVHWDPMGVIAIISPWNYPLMLPFGELLPALIAGNAVVFKPSEFTTRTAVLGMELLYQAGLPPALCQLLAGAGDVGAALVEARPDKIFFTGSARTGRKVAVAAAERLIPVNLELGGSDPCLVLADADLKRAASGAIWARFTNGGQACVAAKRVIVERPAYERFVAELGSRVAALRLGPGDRPDTDIGPMIRPSQVDILERQLGESVARGARVMVGGRRRPDIGPTFFEPTVVTDVPLDAPVWREEVFGPVMPIVVADDAEHALQLANDSAYGLSASIWTGNRARGEVLARRIEAGAVQINDATCHVGAVEVPHGGEKESGLGRSHGEWGLLETCRPRFVASDRLDWIRKPWWFGYHADSADDRDAFLRFAFSPNWWDRIRAVPGAVRMLRNRRPV
jgi:succinate-semialdehyde dehydrogenase/glutarate-semialdehyde dehydrogenase